MTVFSIFFLPFLQFVIGFIDAQDCPFDGYKLTRDGKDCYTFIRNTTQENAINTCKTMGGHLASIHSEAENTRILSWSIQAMVEKMANHSQKYSILLGAYKIKDLGRLFQWIDRSPMDYTNWDVAQPDNAEDDNIHTHGEQNCIEMYLQPLDGPKGFGKKSVGKWNDIGCGNRYFSLALCKFALNSSSSTDPRGNGSFTIDSSGVTGRPGGSTFSGGTGMAGSGSNSTRPGTGGTGGTGANGSRNSSTTASGGKVSTLHPSRGTGSPGTGCTANWTRGVEAGSCFLVILDMRVEDAKAECAEMGATLASIHSDSENQLILDMVRKAVPSAQESTWRPTALLGGHRTANDNKTFHWDDKTKMDYKNMQPDEPNQQGDEGCLEMFLRPFKTLQDYGSDYVGKWNDYTCNHAFMAAVCQIRAGGAVVPPVDPNGIPGGPTKGTNNGGSSGTRDPGAPTGVPNWTGGTGGTRDPAAPSGDPSWTGGTGGTRDPAAPSGDPSWTGGTGGTRDPAAPSGDPSWTGGTGGTRDPAAPSGDPSWTGGTGGTRDPAAPSGDPNGPNGNGGPTQNPGAPSKGGADGGHSPLPTQPVIAPSKDPNK